MTTFEIGKTYITRSACDHNCVWSFTVTKRTASTITVTDGESSKVLKIIKKLSEFRGAETVRPLGNYSMAPMLSADSMA